MRLFFRCSLLLSALLAGLLFIGIDRVYHHFQAEKPEKIQIIKD
ncbi:hypothetical protein [Piscirickettsia salmonis]|nr:hypothetical protein [Piscirickettsia salmonis]ERL62305.1 hypothetical protein K661_01339 [Piscirickettsia salmonis LF-89 = ATCC VR-1361]